MPPVPLGTLLRRTIPPTFRWPLKFWTYTTLTTYILSVLTGNVSQVDRVWTFLPTIYSAYYALLPLWPHTSPLPLFPYVPRDTPRRMVMDPSPRALVMVGLQVIWMLRLSYNTWRRGLFNIHEEDYRWQVLREKIPRWLFQVINFTFIAVIQNIILFLLAIPTHIAASQPHAPLATSDYILGALALLTLAVEFTADNQQFSFQTFKRTGFLEMKEWPGGRIRWTEEDVKRGFVTRGLWAWSRHPNFLCEQTFWIIMTLFPLVAPGRPSLPSLPPHSITPFWPLTPAIVLCLLFFSSTLFTESISRGKYPEAYRAYQNRVAMFVPVLTPVWGLLLKLRGEKERVDAMLWGQEEKKEQ
ncbi:DUF1295-domain-containing protein [Gloeophyllum trabeum ATCC 11539]|uniref:DUF1295-domain-containing protein n=1 Tax=Gloeophyllum trabeum (strain ATCC 11539 / FP-39264 / Madison 617) TaxID=670483 RepID=S7RJ93_GLOTA|nr:DUF1295-domain-containing protein [Gloeophyllum trabeum ATCC 11539]EPQ52694.1 DUF1295-domain-containing protein [Gloeophyllum trabeum ATCC 11539]